ncbi:MAG TPA: PAS domain-containing protein [Candidatus Methylomirabilis sp.]|nr:PAS domain-containing protein [Candidatus Methylomirabilis sp.]
MRAHVLLALRGAFTASLANRTPFHAQARVRRADGKWRWIETFSQPRLD